MPITLLDIIVLAVMLLSGLLAMIRGFMREILSIAAWGAAALTTLYAYQKLLPTAKTYFNNETVAAVAVVAGVFILTLIVVSIITVRISDMVLDSRIGALDRTLGFLFGLARGLLIMVVALATRKRATRSRPMREECGVIRHLRASGRRPPLTALGLHALQHRGQEAAGIVNYLSTANRASFRTPSRPRRRHFLQAPT
jgi:uncharacterized membrane protein required for colicin V production